MSTLTDVGWMMGKIGGFFDWVRKQKSVPLATPNLSPQQGPDPLPPPPPPVPPPLPSPTPSDSPKKRPPRHADVERGLRSATASTDGPTSTVELKTDDGDKRRAPPFHERMSDGATSIAGCLVGLAFVLLLKTPTGVPPAILCAYCYFAMVDLISGTFIYYLHIARAPSRDVARVQAIAAVVGLAGAVMDGLVLCHFFLEAAQFWGLALALLSTAIGFCGLAAASGSLE